MDLNPQIDLFLPIVPVERQHPQFVELWHSAVHTQARTLINEVAARMGDPNGRFVRDFQSDGFHSRLFELACHAYLEQAKLTLDRRYEQPDFLVSKEGFAAAVEAVTANPPTGQATDISLRNMPLLPKKALFEKVNREFPKRMGRILGRKLARSYHDLPHCRGKPLVLMIGPFFEPGSGFYTDDALLYSLFGAPDGKNEIEPFFQKEDARNVSAVLYCNQFTVSKFLRLSTDFTALDWMKAEWGGTCFRDRGDDTYSISHFSYKLGSANNPKEAWAHGVTLFENSNARFPLPKNFLPASSRVYIDDGMVTREVGELHPVVSFTHMHVASDTPKSLWRSR